MLFLSVVVACVFDKTAEEVVVAADVAVVGTAGFVTETNDFVLSDTVPVDDDVEVTDVVAFAANKLAFAQQDDDRLKQKHCHRSQRHTCTRSRLLWFTLRNSKLGVCFDLGSPAPGACFPLVTVCVRYTVTFLTFTNITFALLGLILPSRIVVNIFY